VRGIITICLTVFVFSALVSAAAADDTVRISFKVTNLEKKQSKALKEAYNNTVYVKSASVQGSGKVKLTIKEGGRIKLSDIQKVAKSVNEKAEVVDVLISCPVLLYLSVKDKDEEIGKALRGVKKVQSARKLTKKPGTFKLGVKSGVKLDDLKKALEEIAKNCISDVEWIAPEKKDPKKESQKDKGKQQRGQGQGGQYRGPPPDSKGNDNVQKWHEKHHKGDSRGKPPDPPGRTPRRR
jgi:hypothetical protein